MDEIIRQKIDELIGILKQTAEGKCAIALAGAHAKGTADASSDIDFYIFAEQAKPFEERKRLIRSAADAGTEPWVDVSFDATPWGGTMDFMYKGTPVETTARTLSRMDRAVEDCLNGKFEIIPATWTSNGYYTFIYLCELSFIKPVWDPDGILSAYQEKTADYPNLYGAGEHMDRQFPLRERGGTCRHPVHRAGRTAHGHGYDSGDFRIEPRVFHWR